MRVILHIGPQKTGTSYMQKRLFQYRAQLAEHNIAYHLPPRAPDADPATNPQPHFSDLGTLVSQGRLDRFAGELAALRAQGVARLVVSAEHLSKLRADQITPLRDLLTGDEVDIYVYCRRWSDRLPSAWWQRVSTGFATPFPDWLAHTLGNATRNWLVNESLLWRRWAAAFGRERLHILSYDVLIDAGADLAEDFLYNRLHFEGHPLKAARRREVHARPPPLEVEVIHNLFRAADAQKFNLTSRIKHRMLERLRAEDMQPFRALAGDAMLTIPIDDNDPVFADSLAAMQGWVDRLVTSDLAPHFMLPQVKATKVLPAEALAGQAAQDAFAALLVGAEKLAELPPPGQRREVVSG